MTDTLSGRAQPRRCKTDAPNDQLHEPPAPLSTNLHAQAAATNPHTRCGVPVALRNHSELESSAAVVSNAEGNRDVKARGQNRHDRKAARECPTQHDGVYEGVV